MEATLDELAEVGYGAMTVESIARRAGVGKATLYRQWSGKLALVESALLLLEDDPVVPPAGSVRQRIDGLLTWLAGHLVESRLAACMPALVSAARVDDAVGDFLHRFTSARRQVLIDLLDEGVANGELPSDLDTHLTAEALAGPLFYRRLMVGTSFPPDRVAALTALVLDGPAR